MDFLEIYWENGSFFIQNELSEEVKEITLLEMFFKVLPYLIFLGSLAAPIGHTCMLFVG